MKYFIFCFFCTQMVLAAHTIKIKLYEKGTRLILKDISVYVLPDKLKGETNAQGEVQFTDVQTEESKIVISAAGYLRLEEDINFKEKESEQIDLYLQKESYAIASFETVITDTKDKQDQSKKTMTRKEFLSMPGANGDPLKAVQNMPGVNRAAGFSSQVIIQGSAPKDTSYDFEGHDIPIVFHFGGLSSVVMPEALEQVDYYSAGYGAYDSRALGGIISLKSRKPDVGERDHKGLFYMDNLSTGGLFESKIDEKSSFLVSGRYSYIGEFLKAAGKNNDSFNLTVAPEFQDLTAVYNRDISSDENFKVSLLGSRDRLAFVLSEPVRQDPSIRGSFSNTVDFFRVIPAWTKKVDADTTYKLSLGLGQDKISNEIGDQYVKINYNVLTTRAEYQYQVNSQWLTQTGLDDQYYQAHVNLRIPVRRDEGGVNNPISSGEKREAEIIGEANNLGLYFKNQYSLTENIELLPALRFDQFSQTKESFLLPRFAVKYKYTDDLLFKMGTGLYVQPPEPGEASAEYGNAEIKSPHAVHFTLGFEKDTREGSKDGSVFTASYFDRWFDRLVVQSSASVIRNGQSVYEVYNNDGRGRSYGVEAQWKFYQPDYSGFISYTWSKSTRWNSQQSEYNFEYDQTHNFNLVVAKDLSNNWKISGRFRHVTGNPQTPVIGATYDADNEVYLPKRGALYSTRLKDFNQLDIRIDKKLITDRSLWTFYLDIQNVLNTKNPEAIQYSYDYSQSSQISGLPILPAIGIKGEF